MRLASPLALLVVLLASLPPPLAPVEEAAAWGPLDDQPFSLAVAPDASAGYYAGTTGELSPQTIDNFESYYVAARASGTGAFLWQYVYDSGGHYEERALDVAAGPDGKQVFSTGFTPRLAHDWRILTVAFDAPSGAVAWSAFYPPGPETAVGNSVAASPDNALVYVGGQGPKGWLVLAYDALSGSLAWTREGVPGLPGLSHVSHVEAAAADYVIASGVRVNLAGGRDLVTVAYTSAGAVHWVRVEAPACGPYGYEARGIAIPFAGDPLFKPQNVYVLAHESCATSTVTTRAYAYDLALGLPAWVQPSPLPGIAAGIATISGREVWVAVTANGLTRDALTLAYDGYTGAPLWSRLEDSGSEDHVGGIAAGYVQGLAAPIVVVSTSALLGSGFELRTFAYWFHDGVPVWTHTQPGPGHEYALAVGTGLPGPSHKHFHLLAWQDGADPDFFSLAHQANTGAVAWTAAMP